MELTLDQVIKKIHDVLLKTKEDVTVDISSLMYDDSDVKGKIDGVDLAITAATSQIIDYILAIKPGSVYNMRMEMQFANQISNYLANGSYGTSMSVFVNVYSGSAGNSHTYYKAPIGHVDLMYKDSSILSDSLTHFVDDSTLDTDYPNKEMPKTVAGFDNSVGAGVSTLSHINLVVCHFTEMSKEYWSYPSWWNEKNCEWIPYQSFGNNDPADEWIDCSFGRLYAVFTDDTDTIRRVQIARCQKKRYYNYGYSYAYRWVDMVDSSNILDNNQYVVAVPDTYTFVGFQVSKY